MPSRGIVLVSERGDHLRAGPHVALQGAQVLVPALGHEQGERDVVLAEVGESGPAHVVQSSTPGGGDEQLLGWSVGEPSPAGLRAEVLGRLRARGGRRPIGQEQRAAPAAADQAGQQPGGAGLEVEQLAIAALGDDDRPLVDEVDLLTSRPSTSSARAAVSYRSRQRQRSRRPTLSRLQSRSSSRRVSTRVLSAFSRRRSRPATKSCTGQPRRREKATKEPRVERWRFQVRGRRRPQACSTVAATAAGVNSSRNCWGPKARSRRLVVWA
jgi:hypothetical protein